jgi:hypothetical protein
MKKENPLSKKQESNKSKSYKKAVKGISPVAKDTNKTRRKDTLVPLKNAVKKKTKP